MRYQKRIREQPFKAIINEEWFRAKEMFPKLKKRPKFYWQKMRGRTHGTCNYSANKIMIHWKYFIEQITDQHFRNIIRHELCHLIIPNHSSDFKYYLDKLEGTRFATADFKTKGYREVSK